MEKDRIKWNKRYKDSYSPDTVSGVVKKYCYLAQNNKALDIAAGAGRNAVFLAQAGFDVDAVDISDVAVNKINIVHPKINGICTDLDTYEIDENYYDLIVNINYLNRRLFPYIRQGLKIGGVLIFETYVKGDNRGAGPVSSKEYLLDENELLHSFLSLKIVNYQEKTGQSRHGAAYIASLVGIKTK